MCSIKVLVTVFVVRLMLNDLCERVKSKVVAVGMTSKTMEYTIMKWHYTFMDHYYRHFDILRISKFEIEERRETRRQTWATENVDIIAVRENTM